MDRKEKLAQIAEELLKEKFISGYQWAMSEIECEGQVLIQNLINSINEALLIAGNLQDIEGKGEVTYINFSFLHSNLLLRQHNLKIDVYDEKYYLDEIEATTDWKFNWLFSHVEEEFQSVCPTLKLSVPRVQEYELFEIKKVYYLNYYGVAIQMLTILLPAVIMKLDIKGLKHAPSIQITCGQYMGRQQCLYVWEVPS